MTTRPKYRPDLRSRIDGLSIPPSGDIEVRKSELDTIESDPLMSVELAAAALPALLHDLLGKVFLSRSDVSQKDMARRLQVSEGRVSQILSGEDDLRVSTFARYFRALGYELAVQALSAEPDAPELVMKAKRSSSWMGQSSLFVSVVGQGDLRAAKFTILPHGVSVEAPEVHAPKYVGEIDHGQSRVTFTNQTSWRTAREVTA